jgi:hypothetical protein
MKKSWLFSSELYDEVLCPFFAKCVPEENERSFCSLVLGMLKWPGAHCYGDNMIVVITRQFGIWKLSMV